MTSPTQTQIVKNLKKRKKRKITQIKRKYKANSVKYIKSW